MLSALSTCSAFRTYPALTIISCLPSLPYLPRPSLPALALPHPWGPVRDRTGSYWKLLQLRGHHIRDHSGSTPRQDRKVKRFLLGCRSAACTWLVRGRHPQARPHRHRPRGVARVQHRIIHGEHALRPRQIQLSWDVSSSPTYHTQPRPVMLTSRAPSFMLTARAQLHAHRAHPASCSPRAHPASCSPRAPSFMLTVPTPRIEPTAPLPSYPMQPISSCIPPTQTHTHG